MNRIIWLDEQIAKISELTADEKLKLSSEIFMMLNDGNISNFQKKKLINRYREVTYGIAKEEPTHYDPRINLNNYGFESIYNSASHASDKILATLKKIKNNELEYKPDKIDLYNFLNLKQKDKTFFSELSHTPQKLLEKYGTTKTTESRFKYLMSSLEKIIIGEDSVSRNVKKVLRISHDYNRNQGGLQEHLQELNKGLNNKNDLDIYQIIPITRKQFRELFDKGKIKKKGEDFVDEYSGVTVKPVFITQSESERMARLNRKGVREEYMQQFNKIFEDINPDILHVHNGYYKPHYEAAKIAKSSGKRVIHTWHGGKINPENTKAKKRLQNTFDKTANVSDKNFAVSEIGKTAYSSNDVNIAYGVDLKYFSPESVCHDKSQIIKGELGLNKDDYVFFFPGRYHEQKNQHTLIEAFKDVTGKYKNAKLLLAGQKFDDSTGSDYSSKLKKLAKKYNIEDKIIFHGKVERSKMPFFYNLSDAIIYPSKNEGRGRSLVEAMAMGKPVLASNDAGLEDSIKTGEGELGYLFDPNRKDQIARKMNQCISEPKKSADLAHKAKHHAHKKLSIDAYVDKYHRVYNGN